MKVALTRLTKIGRAKLLPKWPKSADQSNQPTLLIQSRTTHAYNCYVNFSCCFCVNLNTLKNRKKINCLNAFQVCILEKVYYFSEK